MTLETLLVGAVILSWLVLMDMAIRFHKKRK